MFYERLKLLAKEKKKSLNQIEEDLGFSKNTLYNTKKYTPQGDKLSKLAEYFNVSIDYLLGKTDNREPASSQLEDNIDNSFRYKDWTLTNEKKESVQDLLQLFFETEDYEKTLGYRIKKIRKRFNMSVEEFSSWNTTSLTPKIGEKWEDNSLKPTDEELKSIAEMAQISVKYLLTGKPDLLGDMGVEISLAQLADYAEFLDEETYNKLTLNLDKALGVLVIILERSMLWWQDIHNISEVDPHEIPTLLENLETYSQINNSIFQIISVRGKAYERIKRREKHIPELKANIDRLIEINSRVAPKDFYSDDDY